MKSKGCTPSSQSTVQAAVTSTCKSREDTYQLNSEVMTTSFFGELNSGLDDSFLNIMCNKPNTEQPIECDNNILYYNKWTKKFLSIMEDCVPHKLIKKNKHLPWPTTDTVNLMRKRNNLFMRAKKTGLEY